MNNTIYVLRTCNKYNKSYGGFQWPEKGHIESPDWNPEPICGQGLHGFPRGVGDSSLASWNEDAKWLVVKVDKEKGYVEFGGKCKFKEGEVVYCGSRKKATDFLYEVYGKTTPIIGGYCVVGDGETATAGKYGTAIAGNRGTAIAGNRGTATAGNRGTATAGNRGTAIAGNRGIATAGYKGTATAGKYGRIQIEYYNKRKFRLAVGYVGEDGIEPNVRYRCDNGKFIKVGPCGNT